MNAKIKVHVLNYTPIGNTAKNNICFKVKCQTTNKFFKSPLFNGPSSDFNQSSQSFWEFQIFAKQTQLIVQMIDPNQKQKAFQTISQVRISKFKELTQESDAIFFIGKQRIGAINFRIESQNSKKPIQNKTKSEYSLKQESLQILVNKTKMKPKLRQQLDDSENQRYNVEFTPHQTVNNSVVKLARVQDNSYMQIFNGVDESSIEQREPFSGDQSFSFSDQILQRSRVQQKKQQEKKLNRKSQQRQSQGDFNSKPNFSSPSTKLLKETPSKLQQISPSNKGTNSNVTDARQTSPKQKLETSSLQKWIKKLQTFQKQKEKQASRGPLYKCNITQIFTFRKDQQPNVTLNLLNLTLDSTIDDFYALKSLKMRAIDGQKNRKFSESLFECKFQLINQSQENTSKEMKFKKLMAEIPSDMNVQVEICLQNLDQSDPEEFKISGILMKDKCLETDQIPLFDEYQNLFASLSYIAKKINNASVQYLSPLESFSQLEWKDKINLKKSKDNHPVAKNLIRQRIINKMFKRQTFNDNDSPVIKMKEIRRKPSKQTVLNSGVKANVNRDTSPQKMDESPDSEPKKRKDSTFSQFQRSNTDVGPYQKQENKYKSDIDRESKSSRSPSIKQLKTKIAKMHQEITIFTGNVSLPISPHKHHHHLRLKSTTLADLREEESQDQDDEGSRGNNFQFSEKASSFVAVEVPLFFSKKGSKPKKLATQPDRDGPQGLEETIQHRNYLNNFVIEINAITVVIYEHQKPEESENGKFIILKSESGQTFITDTLFSNHLNLNWKNKSYQFTSSKIEIGFYEKMGFSAQSQSKLMGKIDVKLIDLMRVIKQNFHRAEIFIKDKPIGIVILIYDIFMERQMALNLDQDRRNRSQMKMNNRTQKATNNTNETEDMKQYLRGSEKSTIKVEKKSQNRKRAKTLQSKKKTILLPVIDSPLRRKPYYYEGGKNITIGRAGRFLNTNMAEVVGQL